MRSPRRGSGRRNWGPTAVTPPAPTSRRSPSARSAPGSANPANPASRSPQEHPCARSGRGKQRRLKLADPQARHRWPVEPPNAWLKALPRIGTHRDRKANNYLAVLHLGMTVILTRSFETSSSPSGGSAVRTEPVPTGRVRGTVPRRRATLDCGRSTTLAACASCSTTALSSRFSSTRRT